MIYLLLFATVALYAGLGQLGLPHGHGAIRLHQGGAGQDIHDFPCLWTFAWPCRVAAFVVIARPVPDFSDRDDTLNAPSAGLLAVT